MSTNNGIERSRTSCIPGINVKQHSNPRISTPDSETIEVCRNASYDLNLRKISCAALKLRKYVVINLTMKQLYIDCDSENCTEKWNLYNTNVVFDRGGRVISL